MTGRSRRTRLRGLPLILVVGCVFPGVGPPPAAGASAPIRYRFGADAAAPDPPAGPALPSEASDPFLVSVPGRSLIFTTNTGGANVPVWSAPTASGPWARVGDALPVLPAWAQPGRTWAPGVVHATTGAWLLFFTAWDRVSGVQCIGRAVAAQPEGPYQPTDGGTPFVCYPLVGGSIDASPFLDPWDEHLYLYWKNDGNCCGMATSLWGLALTPDGRIGGPLAELLPAAAAWETGIVERPAMVRWASVYNLFYSGGRWATPWYAEGWARCVGPLGPCARQSANGAWVERDDVAGDGPGGMSVATGPDGRLLAVWHAWPGTSGYENGGSRRTYVGILTMPAADATDEPLLRGLDTDAPDAPIPVDPLNTMSGFTAITPTRIVDTRQVGTRVSRLAAGAITTIAVGSIPALAEAAAITANFTLTGASGTGYLRVWPCDQPEPDVSVANVVAGRDVANGVTVGLARDGTLCARSTVDADIVIDATGRWAPFLGSRFTPVAPRRLLDTRTTAKPAPDDVVRVAFGQRRSRRRIGRGPQRHRDPLGHVGVPDGLAVRSTATRRVGAERHARRDPGEQRHASHGRRRGLPGRVDPDRSPRRRHRLLRIERLPDDARAAGARGRHATRPGRRQPARARRNDRPSRDARHQCSPRPRRSGRERDRGRACRRRLPHGVPVRERTRHVDTQHARMGPAGAEWGHRRRLG